MTEQLPPQGPAPKPHRRVPRFDGVGGALTRGGVFGLLVVLLWATPPVGGPAAQAPGAVGASGTVDRAVLLAASGGYTPAPPPPVEPRQAPAYTPPTYTPPRYTPPTQAHPQPAPTYPRAQPSYPGTQPRPQPSYPGTQPGFPRTQPTYPHTQPGLPGTHPGYPGTPGYPRPGHPHPTPGGPGPSYPYPTPHPTPSRPTPAPAPIVPLPPPSPVRPRSTPAYPPPGTQSVSVPRVNGLGLYVAEDRLRQSGLAVGSVTVQSSADTPGSVVQSNPRAGASVQAGSTVDLVVAVGS